MSLPNDGYYVIQRFSTNISRICNCNLKIVILAYKWFCINYKEGVRKKEMSKLFLKQVKGNVCISMTISLLCNRCKAAKKKSKMKRILIWHSNRKPNQNSYVVGQLLMFEPS